MVDSYNCLRLNNKHVFQVEVYEDKDRQKFFEFGIKKIPFVNLRVGQLAKFISEQEKFEVSKLWKVDVDKSKLNPGSTDDDIKELGGVSMEFEYDFIKYFQEDYEPTRNKIHIVATTTGKCLPTFYLSNKKFCSNKISIWSDLFFFISNANLCFLPLSCFLSSSNTAPKNIYSHYRRT